MKSSSSSSEAAELLPDAHEDDDGDGDEDEVEADVQEEDVASLLSESELEFDVASAASASANRVRVADAGARKPSGDCSGRRRTALGAPGAGCRRNRRLHPDAVPPGGCVGGGGGVARSA